MPKIYNLENNLSLELNLFQNDFLDIEKARDDTENWIPFGLLLDVEGEIIGYGEEDNATFTVYEIKELVKTFENIIKTKLENGTIDNYDFYSSESFFEIIIKDPLEEDLLYIDLWFNLGSLTNGKTYGYDKGFRFLVALNSFKKFTDDLTIELANVLGIS